MKTIQVIILTVMVVILPCSIFAQTSAGGFKVGAAKVDITPDMSAVAVAAV